MKPDILIKELQYRTARSGGKGGQNVNKVETKVEAYWDVASSTAIDDAEKLLILEKLSANINKEGHLQVINQTERSQLANKLLAEKKLLRLVEKALKKEKVRKETKTPPSVIAARSRSKQHNSEKKTTRKKVKPDDTGFDFFDL
jgi:ribosome-associated protein